MRVHHQGPRPGQSPGLSGLHVLTGAMLVAALMIAGFPAMSHPEERGSSPPRGAPKITVQTHMPAGAGCLIQDNNTGKPLPSGAHGDALFKIVTSQAFCPDNALVFRDILKSLGLTPHPAMVANRGYHNPLPQGLFSFFEAVTGTYAGAQLAFGDWFFGHFQVAVNNDAAGTSVLAEQQEATSDALLLESVVWDPTIGMYRFYEIRGSGQGGVWFYRGNSLDILMDIKNVWRNTDPTQLLFGEAPDGARLRCSGCHMNGGPLMKELKFPHDSWWRTERPLLLGSLVVQPAIKDILANVVDASRFASWVNDGYAKLFSSKSYMQARSERTLQEQLRPVFCEQEVNLESDLRPLSDPGVDTIQAPAGFFLDPRLLPQGAEGVTMKKNLYVAALKQFNSLFLDYQAGGARPTDGIDADHAFETPVKGRSDMLLAEAMVKSGLIDEEFVLDVVALDMTRPMFSDARCGLLLLVPDQASDGWRAEFTRRLQAAPQSAAQELFKNLTDPQRTAAFHREQAAKLLRTIQANVQQQSAVTGYVRLLAQRRIAVYQAQISQHPQGQIFEPGFRLIFPTMQLLMKNQQQIAYGGVPGQYWLNPASGLVELAPSR